MLKHVGKRGDTLIEVMLAVGIFSMVAVAVVAVMSGGTTSSQASLETTLAREEIDTQAEAIRFIHRSYIADKNTGQNSIFGTLWREITSKAVNSGGQSIEDAAQFHPANCQDDLYATGKEAVNGLSFVIDPKALVNYEQNRSSSVIITGSDKLKPASTYPHLIYTSSENDTTMLDHSADLIGSTTNLYRAEGIYVVVVKDPETTSLAGSNNFHGTASAYYDFYIRTCWYSTGDQSPSTISTVIRLYNPDIY